VAALTIFINGTATCLFDTYPHIFITKIHLKFCPKASLSYISPTPPTYQFIDGTVDPKIVYYTATGFKLELHTISFYF